MDIWCIGDLNYLVAVLNGLAMLSNAGIFNELVKVGLIIAVLMIAFQVIFQTGGASGVPWGKFVLAFIAFKLLFGSGTTVHVHDTYTLQSQNVDNVPYGVAVTGSVCSKIAHEITEHLEQAFSTPRMTESGFGSSLESLSRSKNFISGLATLHDGKIVKTLVEYCEKCTSVGINLGQKNINAIKTAADPWRALKWDSNIYYAMTWLRSDPPEGTLRTCSDAWSQIDNYLRGQLWTDWNDFLSAQICIQGAGTCNPTATVQDALDALTQTAEDAQDFMLASILLPLFEEGKLKFDASLGGSGGTPLSYFLAQFQRNEQWREEGSLFQNVARPMMAFFEGFLYAITPFMAMLVAFVPAGLSLIGKYFMMFVWVQLWMPILSILNHFQYMVLEKKLSCLIDGNIPLTSLQGHPMAISTIQDWYSTVGLLVASTPAISLALLFGGAITMTHLAGRLQHGDHITEQIDRPNVIQPAAAIAMRSPWRGGDSYKLHKTGMEGPAGEVSLGDTIQSSVASLRSEIQTSGIAFGQSLRETIASGGTAVSGLDSGTVTTDGRVSDVTESQALSIGYGQSVAHRSGLSKEAAQKFQSVISGELSGSAGVGSGYSTGKTSAETAGFKLIGPDGHISTKLKSAIEENFGTAEAQQLIRTIESDIRDSGQHGERTMMQDRLATDSKTGEFAKYMEGYDTKKVQDTQKAGKRLYDAKKDFSEAVQMSRTFSGGAKINLLQAAPIWREIHGSAGKYASLIPGVHEGWQKEVNWAKAVLGASQANAEWIGLFRRLNHMSRQGDMDAFKKLSQLGGEALGVLSMNMGDPYQYKDGVPSGLTAYADGIEKEARGLQDFAPGEVERGISGIRDRASGHIMSKEELAQDYAANSMASIHANEKQAKQNIFSGHEQAVRDKENQLGPLKNKAQSVAQWASSGLNTISGFGSAAKVMGSTVASATMSGFRSLLEGKELENPQEFLNEGMKGYMQSLVAEGKAHGFSDAMSRYYAQTRGAAFAKGLSLHFGRPINESNWITWNQKTAEQQAVGDQAKFYRDHGMSAPEARELAERDMRLVKDTAESGGNIAYAAPVGQVRDQIERLEDQTRAMRERVIMGAPRAGGKVGSLDKEGFWKVSQKVNSFDGIVQRAGQKYDVDPNLIKAVITAESKGDPHAINDDSGAKGLMQLMDGTAEDYGIKPNAKDIYDPEKNIMAGTEHLAKMLDRYHGNTRLALAAYNWGHGNLDESGGRYEHIKETRNFVQDVTAYHQQYAAMDYHRQGQEMAGGFPELRKGKTTIQELRMAAGLPAEQQPISGEQKSEMLAEQPGQQTHAQPLAQPQVTGKAEPVAQGTGQPTGGTAGQSGLSDQSPAQPQVSGKTGPAAEVTGTGQPADSGAGQAQAQPAPSPQPQTQEMMTSFSELRHGKVTIQELGASVGVPAEQKPGGGEQKSEMLAKQPEQQTHAQPSAQPQVSGKTEPAAEVTGTGQPADSGAGQAQAQPAPSPQPEGEVKGTIEPVAQAGQPARTDHTQVAMAGNPLAPNSQAAPPSEKSWGDYAWSLIGPSQAHAAEGPPMAGTGQPASLASGQVARVNQGASLGGQSSMPGQPQVQEQQPEPITQVRGAAPGPEQVRGREGEVFQVAEAIQPEQAAVSIQGQGPGVGPSIADQGVKTSQPAPEPVIQGPLPGNPQPEPNGQAAAQAQDQRLGIQQAELGQKQIVASEAPSEPGSKTKQPVSKEPQITISEVAGTSQPEPATVGQVSQGTDSKQVQDTGRKAEGMIDTGLRQTEPALQTAGQADSSDQLRLTEARQPESVHTVSSKPQVLEESPVSTELSPGIRQPGPRGTASEQPIATAVTPEQHSKIKGDPSQHPISEMSTQTREPSYFQRPNQPKPDRYDYAELMEEKGESDEAATGRQSSIPSDHFSSWGIAQTQPPSRQPVVGQPQGKDKDDEEDEDKPKINSTGLQQPDPTMAKTQGKKGA